MIFTQTCCALRSAQLLSLDLCLDFTGSVAGQASFSIHVSQKYPILERAKELKNQN